MDRVNNILKNEEFCTRLAHIRDMERDRVYCRHGIDHLLSVARIMYIESMERGIDIDRDVLYATALLHDIGRSESSEFHDSESAKIAVHILDVAGYSQGEILDITRAIGEHRGESTSVLSYLLHRADKSSRECYMCEARSTCKWDIKIEEIVR